MMQPLEADSIEVAPPMVFSLRISLPDLPGMLGRVARAFGKGDVNILTLDVVDRKDGTAVDDVRVEAPRGMQEALRRAAAAVPGFLVEYVRPLEAFRHVLEPLELAALLEESGPAALILAASLGAPSAARLPAAWLDFSLLDALGGGREVARQAVPHDRGDGLEVAAALLDRPSAAVVLGRQRGPRFRASELRYLGLLARIAAAVSARSGTLIEAI